MSSLKALALAGAVALGATTANAADLLPPSPAPMPVPAAQEFSGWYLRGDVGIGVSAKDPKLSTLPNPLLGNPNGCSNGTTGDCYSNAAYTGYQFFGQKMSNATFVALGVGYQLNNWLRFDGTLEWRGGSRLSGVDQLTESGTYTYINANGTIGFGPQNYNRNIRNFYSGNVSSLVAMVNGYVDLGTYWGVTPYLGAGVGVAYNRISGLTDTGFSYTNPGAGYPTGGWFHDGTKTNFAWALMAGLGYSVSPNLKLELGYRYMNLGKAESGGSRCFNGSGANGGFDNCSYKLSVKSIESHDIKLGMRWMLSGDAPQPAYAPFAPLVRKY